MAITNLAAATNDDAPLGAVKADCACACCNPPNVVKPVSWTAY